jgi:broad specificity phosphatase PhoE
MATLYLVRHGQASFGAEDYDNLSELGRRQSQRLGAYWAERGLRFDAVIRGSLKRHVQTLDGILEGLGPHGRALPPALEWPGLNEYDSAAVLRTVHPGPLQKADTPEQYRQHFRLLREGLTRWMQGTVAPEGMPTYRDFAAGVAAALDHVRLNWHGLAEGNVLLVSSGGPISTAVGQVLSTPPETTIEMNLRIRNASFTTFDFNPKRHALVAYNTLPHLDGPEHGSWITYT